MKPVQRLGHFWPFFLWGIYYCLLEEVTKYVASSTKKWSKNGYQFTGATFVILSYDTNCSMSGFENIISLHNFCVYTV